MQADCKMCSSLPEKWALYENQLHNMQLLWRKTGPIGHFGENRLHEMQFMAAKKPL